MGLKTSIEQEKIVFAYMLKRPQYLLHIEKDFFSNDDIQYVASSAKQFFKEYKETPSCEQMKAILKRDNERLNSVKYDHKSHSVPKVSKQKSKESYYKIN